MKFAKLHEAIEIAKRLEDRLHQIAKEYFENNPEHEYKGSEDYADAISYIGDLFQAVSAEMLYTVYSEGPDFSDKSEIVEQMKDRMDEANEDAMHALQQLRLFALHTPTIDDI